MEFLTVSQYPQYPSMPESFIEKVAGYWLIKKRLQHSCFLWIMQSLLRAPKEPLQVAVDNDTK